MTAQIIDGKGFAAGLCARIAERTGQLKRAHGIVPGLAVALVGDDPASHIYVRNKAARADEVGMRSFEHRLPGDAPEAQLLALIARLNGDPQIHGILVQLPLPPQIDAARVCDAIAPAKDVDGFHALNVGRLALGQRALIPCTPLGCLMLLTDHLGDLSGRTAAVVGCSNIVGKPMTQLLLHARATVSIAHRSTVDLPAVCRGGEILVVAAGQPGLVRGDWIRPGATVIDVGINRLPAPERGEGASKIVGDVAFDEALEIAGAITPTPGGVGPMTIACLLANALTACRRAHGLEELPELSGAPISPI